MKTSLSLNRTSEGKVSLLAEDLEDMSGLGKWVYTDMCHWLISWLLPFRQPHSTLTYTRPHNVSWHIWHMTLIICWHLLGVLFSLVTHKLSALSLCGFTYVIRTSTFNVYIHIHSHNKHATMQKWPKQISLNRKLNQKKKNNKEDSGSKTVFFFLLSATELISLHTPTLPPSFAFPLITTVPQRALWRALLYSPAHHHAKRWLSLHCKPLL